MTKLKSSKRFCKKGKRPVRSPIFVKRSTQPNSSNIPWRISMTSNRISFHHSSLLLLLFSILLGRKTKKNKNKKSYNHDKHINQRSNFSNYSSKIKIPAFKHQFTNCEKLLKLKKKNYKQKKTEAKHFLLN